MAVKIGGGNAVGGSRMPEIAGVEGSATKADINMTPMIDIMLVLLIIFMIITPALGGYSLVLPKAVTAAPEKEDRVTLAIDNQGLFYLNEDRTPTAETSLEQALRTAYLERPDDRVLYLKADRAIEYSVVLTAIDAARRAGVRRVGAITEQLRVEDPET